MSGDVHAAALACLRLCDPGDKVHAVPRLLEQWRRGDLAVPATASAPEPVREPGRPARPALVSPRALPRRGLGTGAGRAALVHAVAHIEFNAINLALDAAYRFRGLPADYYGDWLRVAADEARHFHMLDERLRALGYTYGDYPAHDGLWQMAVDTADDWLARMALVPRVLEARGLDVTPGMIERFRAAGDAATAAILEVILEEEVAHVAIGSRWFEAACRERALEPESTFRSLLQRFFHGGVRGPFNHAARRAAGFSASEMAMLEALGGARE